MSDVAIPPPTLADDTIALLLCPEATEQLSRVIGQDTTLLLTGETGTGKTRLAQRIHELSPRRGEPFLVVDCGSLSPTLIESELFGHVAGAFTGADNDRQGKFAAAGKGTLLLDEINSLPLPLQNKLLRVVDDRTFEPVGADQPQPFQARIIVASNVCLRQAALEGQFRRDLFYRLNIVSFELPPLRLRRGVIAPLARQFLTEFAARYRPEITQIDGKALGLLQRHDWPGNIRELSNVIERAVALTPGQIIGPLDLPLAIRNPRIDLGYRADEAHPGKTLTLVENKDRVELARISEALQKHRNNRLRAAAELGISRMSLYKKLHKYGLMNRA